MEKRLNFNFLRTWHPSFANAEPLQQAYDVGDMIMFNNKCGGNQLFVSIPVEDVSKKSPSTCLF